MSEPSIISETENTIISEENDITSDDPKIMLRYLLPLLSSERFTQEHYFSNVCGAVYNIYEGNEEGLKFLNEISFTKRNEVCKVIYTGTKNKSKYLSISMISYYAKEDSPKLYELWHQTWYSEVLNKTLSGDIKDVSSFLYKFYMLDFSYNSLSNDWFGYKYSKLYDDFIYNSYGSCSSYPYFFWDKRKDFSNIFDKYRYFYRRDSKEFISFTDLMENIKNYNYFGKILLNCKDYFKNNYEKYYKGRDIPNTPYPQLNQINNSRLAIITESDERQNMNSGEIGRINGYCPIYKLLLNDGRIGNYGRTELTCKTVMLSNRIPDIANVDKALINRFTIFPFLGTYTNDAPEDIEEQFKVGKFKIDEDFETKIPELAKGLLWLMVQYYPIYVQEKLEFPSIVKEIIEKHWEDNDPYLKFIPEKLEYVYKDEEKKEINIDVTLSTTDLYPVFSMWFKQNYPNRNVPTLPQVKSDLCMTGRLGRQPKRGIWCGIRIK